jgi:AraC-like DNA-binding protein
LNAQKALPRLLWIRCGGSSGPNGHESLLRRHFELASCDDIAAARRDIRMLEPRVLCFDFDAPSTNDLHAMQKIKQSHIRLPILMLTEAHSEELAVWSFRAGVWNYLVKPVPDPELEENAHALAKIATAATSGRTAHLLTSANAPREVSLLAAVGSRKTLAPALRRIETGFAERLREADLASECGMSVCQFSRAFRAQRHITFREYLVNVRITEACRLLQQGALSVTKIAYAVGFNDASYFALTFRQRMGVKPSEYARGKRHEA